MVAHAGYGERVTTGEVTPGRIGAFVRWVVRTPWPVFTLGMVQADIIGALFVLSFLRFGLPPQDRIQLQDLPQLNLAIFVGYLLISFAIGAYVSLRLLVPVFRWQRRDGQPRRLQRSHRAEFRARGLGGTERGHHRRQRRDQRDGVVGQ